MLTTSESQSLIEQIDARQDDVLKQIDELNKKIELLLDEVRPPAPPELEIDGAPMVDEASVSEVNPGDQAAPISQSPQAA